VVGQESDVLEELEGRVQRRLRQAGCIEDLVLAWLWPLEKLAHPGVHGKQAEQAQSCTGAREQGCECSDVRRSCDGCSGYSVGRWATSEFSEERIETKLKRGGLGFEVGEEVEGIVEGGQERREAARACKKSVEVLVLVALAFVGFQWRYLFRRRIMRSGVPASETTLFGTRCLTSAAMLFSCAGGMLVAPSDGAPGSADGSDMIGINKISID
jgi:hypothetical protein